MYKQDWMVIVAGEQLVDQLTAEQQATVRHTGSGFASDQLCALQQRRAARGVLGAEIVVSNHGCSVRYDSGLQNFGLLAGSKCGMLDGTLEHAVQWATAWVAQDPSRRYAWRRKTQEERNAAEQ